MYRFFWRLIGFWERFVDGLSLLVVSLDGHLWAIAGTVFLAIEVLQIIIIKAIGAYRAIQQELRTVKR